MIRYSHCVFSGFWQAGNSWCSGHLPEKMLWTLGPYCQAKLVVIYSLYLACLFVNLSNLAWGRSRKKYFKLSGSIHVVTRDQGKRHPWFATNLIGTLQKNKQFKFKYSNLLQKNPPEKRKLFTVSSFSSFFWTDSPVSNKETGGGTPIWAILNPMGIVVYMVVVVYMVCWKRRRYFQYLQKCHLRNDANA